MKIIVKYNNENYNAELPFSFNKGNGIYEVEDFFNFVQSLKKMNKKVNVNTGSTPILINIYANE